MTTTQNSAPPKGADRPDDAPLREDIDALLKGLRSQSRRLSRAKNLLALVKGEDPEPASYPAWLEAHRGLEGLELPEEDLDQRRREVVGRIGQTLERLRIKARMAFVSELAMLAEERELELEKISESPLVFWADPLTLEVDFDRGDARLLYGHEPIDEFDLDAATLLDAHSAAVELLEEQAMDSERFFALLHAAYRTVLVADGAEPGERIDLVDVLVPLSMLRAERTAWRRKGCEALEPFPRHLLAFQLAKLRRDGMLDSGGERLELGAATGGSTRNKQDVLYVPVGATGGQYYGSLRFD